MSINNIKIGDVMRKPLMIEDSADFYTVLKMLIEYRTNSLLVVDRSGKLVGEVDVLCLIKQVIPPYIGTDDISAHFATEEIFKADIEKAKDTPVTQFMVRDPQTLTLKSSLIESTVLAMANEQGRIPVVNEAHEPIGVLTRTEIKQVIGKHFDIEGCFTG